MLKKYPRTRHIEGSRLQAGDEDLGAVPFDAIAGRHLVVEEKMDGANSGVSFDAAGKLLLQSRGHYLRGGPREAFFAPFKTWANAKANELRERLGTRYVLYGEWLYAKHTMFYDRLPHYFLEFDVLDRERDEFLSTPRRRALLAGLPVVPVAVLHEGPLARRRDLEALLGRSLFKGEAWKDSLDAAARASGQDPARVRSETDLSDDMEGLYVKVEEAGRVTERLKFIRASFLQSVQDSGNHWLERPLVPNRLAPGVEIWT